MEGGSKPGPSSDSARCRALQSKPERKRVRLYTGKLILDLIASVEKTEHAVASAQREINRRLDSSEPEQFAQPPGLGPADWNLALLLIIHAQLVRTLEPGHDFPNPVDVHEVGAVSAPEQTGIQTRQ